MSTSADSFHSHSEGHPPSSDALDSLDAVEHSSSMAARENRHEPELDQTQVTSREGLALSSIDQIWNSSPRNTARITFDGKSKSSDTLNIRKRLPILGRRVECKLHWL